MAMEAKMKAPFSTLELVKNDSTANAPEFDSAAAAPEHDCTTETAQVDLESHFPS